MKLKITWLHNGFIQTKQLVRCRKKSGEITMNSLIYRAIADGSYEFNTGYGRFKFTASEIVN